ncbi:MAG: lmo0937 family membrane protein [Dehalococcoidales bacterium]|nr:lmo0937 family membrane protein [Dehalococcoidales bacterium]
MPILLIIGIILFVLWLLGLFAFKSLGGLIHIALVIASHSHNYLAAESSVQAILAIPAF